MLGDNTYKLFSSSLWMYVQLPVTVCLTYTFSLQHPLVEDPKAQCLLWTYARFTPALPQNKIYWNNWFIFTINYYLWQENIESAEGRVTVHFGCCMAWWPSVAFALCIKRFPGNVWWGGVLEGSIYLFMLAYYETPFMVNSQSDWSRRINW